MMVRLTMKGKTVGGLGGENKYICLICIQAFQLLKLSISPVAIPVRVLDRQETSRVEYQVALHVRISTQRMAMYTHAERTRTNHPQAHKHLDAITHLRAHTS